MGKVTKIDWCDSSWNPVTGCLKGCGYCYARTLAKRFQGYFRRPGRTYEREGELYVLDAPLARNGGDGKLITAPYPFGFQPTFHRYRLGEPARWTKGRNIFVGSMCDLLGDWVPDSWIKEVMDACLDAPQHRYLFLTKFPMRYIDLINKGIIPQGQDNFWLGTTVPTPDTQFFWHDKMHTFISVEPILKPFGKGGMGGKDPDWIIVGRETGGRRKRVIPEKTWVEGLMEYARINGIPLFMKDSIQQLMGRDFVKEFPWEVK